MNEARRNLVAAAIVLIIAWVAFSVVSAVRQSTSEALGPVNAFSTQAAGMLNPTPTILPDPVTIVRDIRTLARLETIQYSLEKVITAETNQGNFGFLIGDKLLFVAHGTVIAGVDLSKMDDGAVTIAADGSLSVRLPEAEIFIATLDNDKSYVYDRQTGIFNKGEVDLETAARQAAEDEILKAALEDGILDQAQINAENYLARLLRDLGYPEVEFLHSTE